MKITSTTTPKNTPGKRFHHPVIGLERPPPVTLQKGEYVILKCRTIAGDVTSPTYDLPVPYFKTGTPEEFLNWRKNLSKAMTGQNCVTAEAKYGMARRLLDGDALAAFNQSANSFQNEDLASFEHVIAELTAHVFPNRAAQTQKRYMRRFLKKPTTMSTKAFFARFIEINEMFPFYPPHPGSTADVERFDEEELLDILEFSCPYEWKREMLLQNFDPVVSTLEEFSAFCERLEHTHPHVENKTPKKEEKTTSTKRKKRDGQSKSTDKFCTVHGKGNHDTSECYTLKRKANKLRKSNPEMFNGKKTEEMMNILNNVVTKMSNAGINNTNKMGIQEINNFENLTVSSDDNTDIEDLEKILLDELEEGEIIFNKSDMHE